MRTAFDTRSILFADTLPEACFHPDDDHEDVIDVLRERFGARGEFPEPYSQGDWQ